MTGAGRLRRWGIAAASVTLLAAAVPAAGCTSPAGHPAAGPPRAAIAAGAAHSLQLRPDGSVWAWGGNQAGQLGDGRHTSSTAPVRVAFPSAARLPVTRIAAGGFRSLALDSAGHIWTWGASDRPGADPTTDNDALPVEVPRPRAMAAPVTALAAGYTHALTIDHDGRVWAWGTNRFGELGDGRDTDSAVPVPVAMPTAAHPPFVAVSAGVDQSLALDSTGDVWVWGGPGDSAREICHDPAACPRIRAPRRIPVPPELRMPVTAIAAGSDHALLLDSAGRAWMCDLRTSVQVPTPVGGNYQQFRHIAAGVTHWLAIDTQGRPWAWGEGWDGKLGNGSSDDRDQPVPVSLPGLMRLPVQIVAAGQTHSLALDTDGQVWAWGGNTSGQLGNRSTMDSPVAVPVR